MFDIVHDIGTCYEWRRQHTQTHAELSAVPACDEEIMNKKINISRI